MHPFAYGASHAAPKCCVAQSALARRGSAFAGPSDGPSIDPGVATGIALGGFVVSLAWTGFAVYGIVQLGKKRRWW